MISITYTYVDYTANDEIYLAYLASRKLHADGSR